MEHDLIALPTTGNFAISGQRFDPQHGTKRGRHVFPPVPTMEVAIRIVWNGCDGCTAKKYIMGSPIDI